ncbi:MAG: hypothetical protein ACLQPH_13655 [Acidimicrobiales bacterium]
MPTETTRDWPAGTWRFFVAPLVCFAGWCAFAAYLLVQARAGPPIAWTDTRSYVSVARHSLWSGAFWVGLRPPAMPLLIKVFGASTGFVTAQAAIGAISWGILAWTVGRLVTSGWRRLLAVWIVLAFATTFPITLWNRSVLSESLSMSLLALVFASVIWTARRFTWPRAAATTVACLCFATTRDAQVWTVALLGVAVGIAALARVGTNPRGALRAGALAICLLAATGLAEAGTVASHRTNENISDVFYVRVFPYPERVAWFAAHGMPERRQIDALARAVAAPPGGAKVVAFSADDPSFRSLRQWLATKGQGAYLLWLVTHPWYLVSEPLARPEQAFNSAQGNLMFYAATNDAMRSPLTTVMWPSVLELSIMSALAPYLAVLSEAWRERAWWAVLVLTGIGVLSMAVAWHGDGQEVTRHTVEGFAEVRLGVWILVVVGLFGIEPLPGRAGSAGSAGGTGDAGAREDGESGARIDRSRPLPAG